MLKSPSSVLLISARLWTVIIMSTVNHVSTTQPRRCKFLLGVQENESRRVTPLPRPGLHGFHVLITDILSSWYAYTNIVQQQVASFFIDSLLAYKYLLASVEQERFNVLPVSATPHHAKVTMQPLTPPADYYITDSLACTKVCDSNFRWVRVGRVVGPRGTPA